MTRSLVLFIILIPLAGLAQQPQDKVYQVNHSWEVPLTLGGFGLVYLGYDRLRSHSELGVDRVNNLDKDKINSFDRAVFKHGADGYEAAQRNSDIWVNSLSAAPLLLLLDKPIRKEWANFLTLYLESHLLGSVVYELSAFSITRPRPLTYNPDVPMSERSGFNTGNSFFSGHTSTAAASSFFMAKVISDVHRLDVKQQVAIYTLASIPSGLVGYYRIKAGKHFRSDVIVGFLVGAFSGILMPELHRLQSTELSVAPIFTPATKGLGLTYRF
ncbi:MAG: phosphatase PAP2 family protein [Bacteroidia bacterium]|nr:phosphatase PAP2 family protein [Bacteroidia bacterium]